MTLPRISLVATGAVLLTLLFASCDGPGGSLPVRRVLEDKQGRQLEVEIIAKSDGFIAVRRVSDQSAFSIPIADLNEPNQKFLRSIKDSTPEEIDAARQATAPGSAPAAGAATTTATAGNSSRRARWHRDMSMAVAEAKKEDLPIYLLFTGSSWCPPCQSLDSTILSTQEFLDFANENLVLMKVDIPRGTASSSAQKLIAKYSIKSYPTLIILDHPDQIVHKRSGYSATDVRSYNKVLEDIINQ